MKRRNILLLGTVVGLLQGITTFLAELPFWASLVINIVIYAVALFYVELDAENEAAQ